MLTQMPLSNIRARFDRVSGLKSSFRASMATQRELKVQLRNHVKQNLISLNQASISSQSTTAQETILSLPEYKSAQRVGIYLSMLSAEAQTDRLIRDALQCGKSVFVPFLHSTIVTTSEPSRASKKRKRMDMLRLHDIVEYETLGRDSWGIPTLPAKDVETRENAMGGTGPESIGNSQAGLDIIIMPGVAFDEQMNRIGHGAGFYDRFLARICDAAGGRRKPFLVGLCLAEQVLTPDQELAMEEWDWKVDAVAVGDGRLLRLLGQNI